MRRRVLWRLAGETLFLQALFSPRRRQGPGVAAAMTWVPDAGGGALRADRLARHTEGFNTNPALAGPILGALARLESEADPEDRAAANRIERFKRACEAPFAAAGDHLLWRGLRGGGGMAGAAAALIAGGWGPAAFLVVYNAGHLGLRVGGVFWGHARGERAAGLLRAGWFARCRVAGLWLARLAPLVLAGALVSASDPGPAALALAAAAGGYAAVRGSAPGSVVLAGAIIVGLIAARLWG